jgi:signal transduction histidine kinase
MSLAGRFSALFLAALGSVLLGFSTALYVAARVYLDRQLGERLAAALAVLAAAAEVHPEGVEWEPQERILPLGQESGPDRLRWMVFDEDGHRIDHSRNLVDAELSPDWTPRPGDAMLPARLVDRRGRTWRIAQSTVRPGSIPAPGAPAKMPHPVPDPPQAPDHLHPSLVLTVCASVDPVEGMLAALGWSLIALSVTIGLGAGLLCRRLSRRALTPLSRMAASARGLDATDPGWCLEGAGTGDELDELGRAFNELLARLHVAYQRQRRFSSDASHQLRTPLTVLIGQLQVALRRERSGEEYRQALHSALGRAVQLAQIVEALLFLGRADADAGLPRGEALELNHWTAGHLAGRPATGRDAEIVHRAREGAALWVRAHPPLLGQLLDNLLDNAAKYGRPGTPILVETLRRREAAILAVEDRGPGIPAEDLPRVFEPFYRSAGARRQGTSGVGLGLAVAHRIAAAFAGSLTVRSELGSGCRLELRLPLTPPPVQSRHDSEHDGPTANAASPPSPNDACAAPATE